MVSLFILGLVLVNYWHISLVARCLPKNKSARSISELAVVTKDVLTAHRCIHVLCALMFIYFGMYLVTDIPELALAGALLIAAALIDIIQTLVLNERTMHAPKKLTNPHQVAAWLMAAMYLAASVVLLTQAGLGLTGAIPLLSVLLCVTLWLSRTKSKHFLLGQMLFFISVSIALACGAVANTLSR